MRKVKFIISIFCLITMMAFLARPGNAEECNATKTGKIVVSPTELQFYVTQEQHSSPDPITVQVNGFAYPSPKDEDGNDTNATDTIPWEETTDFCWIVSKSKQWIIINDDPDTDSENILKNSGKFYVGIDKEQLIANKNVYGGKTTVYEGNVTVTSTTHEDLTTEAPCDECTAFSSVNIPVRVYVNALRYAEEKSLATTDWLDLTINVPVTEDIPGALYVLAEHPGLAPGQVFAYRWDKVNRAPQFDLFSQWGYPVAGAENLFYAEDIQNTPIAIPFSSDEYPGNPVIPYAPTDVSDNDTDDIRNIKAFIPITFGGGLRLIGLEGDWIIRAIVGDSSNISNSDSWRELLYYVLHIRPVSGTWVVTEKYGGESYTYVDDTGTIYPMILYEERGSLSGVWHSPVAQTDLTVSYANNSTDQICDNTLAVQGHRVVINSYVQPGGYEISFFETSLWGNIEYLYKIKTLDVTGGGYLEGTCQYRFAGQANWSVPQEFSAVREEVVIPLNPSCNCYLADGEVNGYATPFLVDTGAEKVILDINDAGYMGFVDENGFLTLDSECEPCTITGVGGTGTGYLCNVNIEVEGRLKRQNVQAIFTDSWSGPGLLGMSFLDKFHISTSSEDGTMIIAP
jgi:hypothetical protein